MKHPEFQEFKVTQYGLVLLMIIASTFIILFDGQISVQTSHNRSDNIVFRIITFVIANTLFLSMIYTAISAEKIYKKLKNWDKFKEIEGYCVLIAILSFFFSMNSTFNLYPVYGDDFIKFHVSILLIFGIIIPFLWIIIDNRKYKTNWFKILIARSILMKFRRKHVK